MGLKPTQGSIAPAAFLISDFQRLPIELRLVAEVGLYLGAAKGAVDRAFESSSSSEWLLKGEAGNPIRGSINRFHVGARGQW